MSGVGKLAATLRDLASGLAEHAGKESHRRRVTEGVVVDTKSTPVDVVTEIDRWAETFVVGQLLDLRPDDGIIGEEGTAIEGTSGVDWLIDPIDGTTNLVYSYPAWCVSIGASIGGELVAGAVYDPTARDLFAAAVGAGATRNGAPIVASGATILATSLIATGFGYHHDRRLAQAEMLVDVLPAIRDIRRSGSAAFDLCSVACGRVDAYYELGVSAWDVAAGAVIAREAGAIVSGMDGDDPRSGSVIAATPALYDQLRPLVTRHHR